jgi:hypothetical protein
MGDVLYIYFDDPQYLKHAGGLVFFWLPVVFTRWQTKNHLKGLTHVLQKSPGLKDGNTN